MSVFNHITENLLKNKIDIVEDMESRVLVYSAALNFHHIEDIDFDKLQVDDIISVMHNIHEISSDENEYGDIQLDPNHPFGQLNSIQHKIHGLESIPKLRVPSPFRFL